MDVQNRLTHLLPLVRFCPISGAPPLPLDMDFFYGRSLKIRGNCSFWVLKTCSKKKSKANYSIEYPKLSKTVNFSMFPQVVFENT